LIEPVRNRIAGLVGGLGPESTVDYYRRTIEAWKRIDPASAPPLVIDSLDNTRALYLVEHDRAGLIEYLMGSLRRLAGAGADFIAMTANTPHIVFDELASQSQVPLLSIVEVCAEEARKRGLSRLLLLGTRFTTAAPFYPEVFARRGMTIIPPPEADRDWIHDRYIGELVKGEFRDSTREGLISLVERMRSELHPDGVILGGTELPLLLRAPTIAGLPTLDTTALHVDAIVRRLRDD
jgi:aspartate racemase